MAATTAASPACCRPGSMAAIEQQGRAGMSRTLLVVLPGDAAGAAEGAGAAHPGSGSERASPKIGSPCSCLMFGPPPQGAGPAGGACGWVYRTCIKLSPTGPSGLAGPRPRRPAGLGWQGLAGRT